MARVSLSRVYINDYADGSDFVALDTVSEFARSPEDAAQIRVKASGRVRVVETRSVVRHWQIRCGIIDAEQLAWLDAHARALVWVRDPRGLKVCGRFGEPETSVIVETDGLYSATLTLTEITVSEAV